MAPGRAAAAARRTSCIATPVPQAGPIWLLVRIGLVIVGLLQSGLILQSLGGDDFSRPSWSFPLEMTVIIAIGLVFVIGLQARSGHKQWRRPSWYQNPLRFRQPVLLFDASSYYVLASAVGCAVLGLSRTPRNWAWELLLSVGAGLWIGTRLCLALFRGSFEDENGSST